MSRTNLDFLFQVSAPVAERAGVSLPRIDDPGPGFGDHLSQASTTTIGATNTTDRPNDRPPMSAVSSNDGDSLEASLSSAKTAAGNESAADEQHDADESQGAERSGATETATSDATSKSATKESDGRDPDADENELHTDDAIVATAVIVKKSEAAGAASAELQAAAAATDATATNSADAAVKSDEPARSIAARKLPTESSAADATTDVVTVAAETIKTVKAPGEPVSETAASNANRKLRPAKPKPTAETDQRAHRGEPAQDSAVSVEPNVETAPATEESKPVQETANVDHAAPEPTDADRDVSSDESLDANSRASARERTDTTALTNKVPIAVAANAPATQVERNTPTAEVNDGATQDGKSADTKIDSVAGPANRLHANAATTNRGGRLEGTDEMPRVDPARFVGRVAKAFHTAQERGGTLQIRLSPPELGAMRLELTVKDGVMTAALETETTSARRVLLEHLPVLRDRLAEQNIRIERFDVDVRRDGNGGQADPRAAQDEHQPQQGHPEQRRRQAAQSPTAETARPIKPIASTRLNNNGINLVV